MMMPTSGLLASFDPSRVVPRSLPRSYCIPSAGLTFVAPAGSRRSCYHQIAAATAAPQVLLTPCLTRGLLRQSRNFPWLLPLDNFNRVAVANLPGFHHAAENSATPAQRFPKSLPNGIHLVARLAFLRDFQQRFAHAN